MVKTVGAESLGTQVCSLIGQTTPRFTTKFSLGFQCLLSSWQVQGVFFRKYTEAKAKELKLVGWVLNTSQGTVKGQAQGSPSAIERMK